MILNVNDVLRPKFTAPATSSPESSVMRSQGVSDSARFMLQSDIGPSMKSCRGQGEFRSSFRPRV